METSSGAIRTACDIQIEGRPGAERPKLTWKKLTEKDCHEWRITTVDPQERSTLRSRRRSAMHAVSQLPRKGPTDVDDALHLHFNQKSYYDMMNLTEYCSHKPMGGIHNYCKDHVCMITYSLLSGIH